MRITRFSVVVVIGWEVIVAWGTLDKRKIAAGVVLAVIALIAAWEGVL